MARKKKEEVIEEVQEAAEEIQEEQEAAEEIQEAAEEIQEDLDICYVFKEGDNIEVVAKTLTGKNYMVFKVCDYSGVNICAVRPGTVLRWPFDKR